MIMDYQTGYPRPQSVVWYDYELARRRKERWEKLIDKMQSEVTEVEQWGEDIPDSLTRRIFQMYYIDGINQSKIAKKVHLSQSQVSRKIDGFLKDA